MLDPSLIKTKPLERAAKEVSKARVIISSDNFSMRCISLLCQMKLKVERRNAMFGSPRRLKPPICTFSYQASK